MSDMSALRTALSLKSIRSMSLPPLPLTLVSLQWCPWNRTTSPTWYSGSRTRYVILYMSWPSVVCPTSFGDSLVSAQ